MAQTQIKPTVGGSFTNVTTHGKEVTGVSNLPPAQQMIAILASQLYAIGGGVAGNQFTMAGQKHAASVGRVLQWA